MAREEGNSLGLDEVVQLARLEDRAEGELQADAGELVFYPRADLADAGLGEVLLHLEDVEGSDDPDYGFFNAGWKYELNDRWSFIGSAGRSFRHRRSGAPDLLTFLGFQFTLAGKDEDEGGE